MAPARTWAQIAAGGKPFADPSPDAKPPTPQVASSALSECENRNGDEFPNVLDSSSSSCASAIFTDVASQQDASVTARHPDEREAERSLGDAQTAVCVSGSTPPFRAASDITDTVSSTAASEQETYSCVLCSGTGLLCVGKLSDPCPLCGDQKVDSDSDRNSDKGVVAAVPLEVSDVPKPTDPVLAPEAEHGSATTGTDVNSQGPVKEAANPHSDETIVSQVQETPKTCKSVKAPPGLGPPGTWIWPAADDKKTTSDEPDKKSTASDELCWPEMPIDCVEVEFVGRVALECFGLEFQKMVVNWKTASVQGKLILPHARVVLHLEGSAFANSLSPLQRLQPVLSDEQKLHGCHIVRMERAKDNATLHFTCIYKTDSMCWDMLKLGRCPRPACTWAHPVPILISVSCADNPEGQQAKASLMAKVPLMANAPDKIQSQEYVAAIPPSRNHAHDVNSVNINPAYDDDN